MISDHFSMKYEDDLLACIALDERVSGRYIILCYIPALQYETTSDISDCKNCKIFEAETFDVFKVYDKQKDVNTYLSYGDHDTIKFTTLKTIKGYVNKCKIK